MQAARKIADSAASEVPAANFRSRITNGRAVVPGVDGRSLWARRLHDVMGLHIADLGGEESISEAEKSIVRRAATLTIELEQLEAKFATDGQATADALDLYQRVAGNLRRLLEAIGLQRRPRLVHNPLADHFARPPERRQPS